ncbi:hypothetical protein FRC08_004922 [Ceratobasidium sp. 394]|nr:hypothetical protein FRC08_004922 [Ceratobasidium sp. 394]
MLACDLVCFALDHPAAPPTPHPSLIPSSPFSIPSTPFSYIASPPIAPPKTTVVLVSGDRDFAYPLAVLKARKYDVGLIVPPGGAHPALRAQASWVLNWKDVMEDTRVNAGSKDGSVSSVGTKTATHSTGQSIGLGAPVGASSQPAESRTSPRRSSFASRRGSVSTSLRASSSSPSPIPPLPPPPPPAESSTSRGPTPSPVPSAASGSSIRRPPLPPPPPEELSPQLPPTPKMSRRPSIRRAAKTGSRPPSRSRSRVGARGAKSDNRPEQGVAGTSKTEQKKPQPTIIPVPLTVSPVGSGPSFAAMSPQGYGRPHTPPLFSTHPVSPSPPAAPPSLPPPPTPPVKVSTPPTKPPTPSRDATRTPHRPSVPHVSTPRPPVPTPQEPATSSKVGDEIQPQDPSARATPPAAPAGSILQSLVPAAPALRPTNVRPPLTVPSLTAVATNSSALTPATPVTPPASPPFRHWARLQPVNDETDADADQATAAVKRAKKGKERSTEDLEVASREKDDGQQHGKSGQTTPEESLNVRQEPAKLAVDVGMAIKINEQPSAISGVDSILRSYSERTPCVERDNQPDHFDQACEATPIPNQSQAPPPEDEDEDEEKFDESYFASLARSPPTVSANWTPPAANALRTPGTVKAMPLDFILGECGSSAGDSPSPRPALSTTPRPLLRTHSLPIGVPIMQTLLAGLEVNNGDFKRNSLDAHIELLEAVRRDELGERPSNPLERVYSRAGSPPVLPPFAHRTTLPSTSTAPVTFSTLGLSSNPSADSTYREFQVLIDALERYRRSGNERPLRSLIGTEFSREFFVNAGVSSFREYVNRASAAGVVDVGGGSVQGREWISLNRQWQGINSGFE